MPRDRKLSLREGMNTALATTAASAAWTTPVVSDRDQVQTLPVAAIAPNIQQPRRLFPERAMRELRDSITQHGVLVPILVRPFEGPGGARYQIVAGERRWRASGELNLETIPAVVRDDIDDRAAIELALVENLQRRNIEPMEEARALRSLLELGYNQEVLARRLGKSPAHISDRLRLTTLPDSIQELVLDGRLSSSAARNVARIADADRQQAIALELAKGNYTMRQVEILMRTLRQHETAASTPTTTETAATTPPATASEPSLIEPGQDVDLTALRQGVAQVLAAVRALPIGLDIATQAAVAAELRPLAPILVEWTIDRSSRWPDDDPEPS